MAYERLYNYAVNAIADILPIDKDQCKEMVTYALSLPSDHELESHFLDFLGPSDATFSLIHEFKRLKKEDEKKMEDEARLAEIREEKAKERAAANNKNGKTAWNNAPVQKPASGSRLKNNKTSVMTSELADSKPSNKLSRATVKKTKKKNLDNLKDIEAALNDLEVEKTSAEIDHSSSTVRRKCNCMATRHPLFEVAPNCLNCGKIICSKEGLQPCSFCGRELLSAREKNEIVKILRSEKDLLDAKKEKPTDKAVQSQPSHMKPKKGIKVSVGTGENLWKAQEAALKRADEERKKLNKLKEEDEQKQRELADQIKELEHYEKAKDVNPDLLMAQERLDTLLNFQATGAERTRIIDNAADFEMPLQSSGSMWLSPVERALQLKKQQKQQRKHEEQKKQRTGRTKKVVEMVIKDGKVKMVEKHVEAETTEDDDEIKDLQEEIQQEKIDQELALAKNTWDYENDVQKWAKPVYVSSGSSTTQITAQSLPKHSKVQFGEGLDNDELVVAIPS